MKSLFSGVFGALKNGLYALKSDYRDIKDYYKENGLKKTISDVKTIRSLISGNHSSSGEKTGIFGSIKNYFNSPAYSESDLKSAKNAAQKYFETLENSTSELAKQELLKSGINKNTQKIILSSQNQKAAEQEITALMQTQTVLQKGLNTLKNVGVSLLKNLGITAAVMLVSKGIEYIATKAEREREKLEAELEDFSTATDTITEQQSTLNDSISSYTELATSTGDLASNKEELLKIQEQLAETYGVEAEEISTLTGDVDDLAASYANAVEEMQRLKKKKNKNYLSDNESAYEKAANIVDNTNGENNTRIPQESFLH